jgi:hypothetical protein
MRKKFLTEEYKRDDTSGYMNTKEQRMFCASKILYTPETINIDDVIVKYDMTVSGTNIYTQNIDTETQQTFDYINKKLNNTIRLYDKSTEFYSYDISINIKELFKEFIFSKIMSNRIFQNVYNNQCVVDLKTMIYDYIEKNVLPKYRFSNIILYVEYYSIGSDAKDIAPIFDSEFIKTAPNGNETNEEYLIRKTNFKNSFLVKNFQINTDPIFDTANVIFKKTMDNQFGFKYYFDIIYKQI